LNNYFELLYLASFLVCTYSSYAIINCRVDTKKNIFALFSNSVLSWIKFDIWEFSCLITWGKASIRDYRMIPQKICIILWHLMQLNFLYNAWFETVRRNDGQSDWQWSRTFLDITVASSWISSVAFHFLIPRILSRIHGSMSASFYLSDLSWMYGILFESSFFWNGYSKLVHFILFSLRGLVLSFNFEVPYFDVVIKPYCDDQLMLLNPKHLVN